MADEDFQHDDRYGALDALGDWRLEHAGQDIRDRPLRSPNGYKFGTIEDMLVDTAREEVVAIRLADGRMCGVEYLEIRDDEVIYRQPRDDAAPAYARVSRPG